MVSYQPVTRPESVGFFDPVQQAYKWKRDIFRFDLLDIRPWLAVERSRDDLEFYEIDAPIEP